MNPEFPSLLSGLRKAKGISQRQAAENLQVSQALLSHYENGIREPGFDFLIRVGEYYGISIDYLLGRTRIRQNPFLTDHMMPNFAANMSDEVLAKLNEESRVLLVSLSLLMVLLARTTGEEGIDKAAEYFKVELYRLFRLMKLYLGETGFEFLNLPSREVNVACDLTANKAMLGLIRHLSNIANSKEEFQEEARMHFAEDVFRRRFVGVFDSFEELITEMEKKICEFTEIDQG